MFTSVLLHMYQTYRIASFCILTDKPYFLVELYKSGECTQNKMDQSCKRSKITFGLRYKVAYASIGLIIHCLFHYCMPVYLFALKILSNNEGDGNLMWYGMKKVK